MYYVLLETSGNQRYIFATNKLKENVGASELIRSVGTKMVIDAVAEAGGPDLRRCDGAQELRDALCDPARNPPLEGGNLPVEIVLATSGKALLLVHEHDIGTQIVRDVTSTCQQRAPGIHVVGAVSQQPFSINAPITELQQHYQAVHLRLKQLHDRIPGPEARFLRLPMTAECASSGLPASVLDSSDPEYQEPISAVAYAKRKAERRGKWRLHQAITQHDPSLRLLKNIDTLPEDTGSLAVVHADGNGMGRVFLSFDRYVIKLPDPSARSYINELRRFSAALDLCTERAITRALQKLNRSRGEKSRSEKHGASELPVVPLVLGGDDLTMVCDGKQALALTHDFLRCFEETSEADATIRQVAEATLGAKRLSACAGIVVIKPHFPFHTAYEMAEQLLQSAKVVKQRFRDGDSFHPVSAIDFHVLQDISGNSLDAIRSRLLVDDGRTSLFARPFLVTPLLDKTPLDKTVWARQRQWGLLEDRVRAIRAKDEDGDRRRLPATVLHDLRNALFPGSTVADSRLQMVYHRHADAGLDQLLADPAGQRTLFWQDEPLPGHPEGPERCTALLDALEASEVLEPEELGPAELESEALHSTGGDEHE